MSDDERTLIGSGAMGDVYVAYCGILERVVVVKEFRTDCVELDEWVDRFEFEHLCAARVDHPNVIRSFRSEARLTPPRIILERVQGMTMAERIWISRPRYPVVVRWFRQILSGLEAIHRAGIVHRDIKPSNIMIDDDDRAVIIDFGLAHCDEIQVRHDPLTDDDEPCVGTPAYMAPEQTRETIVDARADLWAAGASMFEALTGEPPFPGIDAYESMRSRRHRTAPRADRLSSSVPRALADVVEQSLRIDRRERFQSAEEFRAAIEPFMENR